MAGADRQLVGEGFGNGGGGSEPLSPTNVLLVTPPPTLQGTENSVYWAVCRTSYTADPFDGTAVYPIGAQVQNLLDLNFYQRIVYTGTPDAVWTPANWGLLTVFERNIQWNQPWAANVVGEFMGAWDQDPRITTKLCKLPFVIDQDGAQFVQLRNTFNYGWIRRARISAMCGCCTGCSGHC